MEIPPPGSDPVEVARFVDFLVRESNQDQRRTDWLEQADRGLNLYLGCHFETPPDDEYIRCVLNRIQNCVISLVAIQAGDQPKIVFTARETGEPPLVYLNTAIPQGAALAKELAAVPDPSTGQPLDPMQPLPDTIAAKIKAQIQAATAARQMFQAQRLPAPPELDLFPEELLTEVTDQTSTQALQTVFDGMWAECEAPFIFTENILNKNVTGWQPTLYEFDDDEKKHVLTNVHGKHVFPDPIHTDFDRAAYTVYDDFKSAAEAIAKWPSYGQKIQQALQEYKSLEEQQLQKPDLQQSQEQIANELLDSSKIGTMRWRSGYSYEPGGPYRMNFQRGMVIVRTCWIRHQPYPLKPDEAATLGLASWKQTPSGPRQLHTNADGSATCASCGETYSPDHSAGTGNMVTPPTDPNTPCPACGAPMGAQPMSNALILHNTGQDITPLRGAADEALRKILGWPHRFGVRLIRVIDLLGEAVEDRECELGEIGMAANRNVPIPFSPYGQGEPKRLEDLNMAIDRILSAMVTHHAYTAYPPEVAPSEVIDRLDTTLRDCRSKPNVRMAIPPNLVQMVGGDLKKLFVNLDVPTMPADFWRLLDLLLKLIDQEGNQSDVIQGNAPSGSSGQWVANLQNAASQVIRGKSMYTQFWLRRLTKLMVHSIVNRMQPADWKRYLRRYPIQAIEAMAQRNKSIDRDIAINIRSASGAADDAKTQQLIAAKQIGVGIADPTILERLDMDPDAELQKQAEWNRKVQDIAGAQPGGAAAGPAGASAVGGAANNGATPGTVPGNGNPSGAAGHRLPPGHTEPSNGQVTAQAQ